MNYSNKVDLKKVFERIGDQTYAVIKLWPEFPNYYPYSDVDILCLDLQEVIQTITDATLDLVQNGWVIKTTVYNPDHVFLDFFENESAEKLDFRFDLYASLPERKKVELKSAYFFSILENRVMKEVNGIDIYVPSEADDAVIRYTEYIEGFEVRPDKIKHLDWIVENIQDEESRDKFFQKLHLYLTLNLIPVPQDSHFEYKTRRITPEVPIIKDSLLKRGARKVYRKIFK